MAINPWGDGVPEGVWVFVTIYLVILFGIGAYYGNQLRTGVRKATAKDHFLAGRNLGMFTAALSLYASSWSGYTEVGAPGESYSQGLNSFRWVPGNLMYACFTGWLAPRIHFYAHKRDYEGTADFISDRFRNSTLTLTIVALQIFPVCLYVMGQLKGIGATMSSMTGEKLTEFSAALIFVIIMLFYEMVGGMHAIAKTDVIQASILLFGFLLYYIFQSTVFGGLPDATESFLNCARLYDDVAFNPAKLYSKTLLNGSDYLALVVASATSYGFNITGADVSEYYKDSTTGLDEGYMTIKNFEGDSFIYLVADKTKGCKFTPGNVIEPKNAGDHLTVNPDKLSGWLNYHIGSVPFIVYPHVMDRYYASKDVKTLKVALYLMYFSAWISAIPAILIGIPVSAFVKGDSDMTNIADSNSVFATFLMYMIDQNAALYIFGCMICAAAFAAYMSTADSGIMGFSSMISLDVLKHYVPPFNDRSDKVLQQKRIVLAGKVLSCIGAFISLFLVTVYKNFPLGDLYVWQGSFLFQSFPAFFLGMFCPWVCSYSVVIGCWVGFMIVVMMEKGENDTVLPNVFYAFVGNFCCLIGWEILLRLTKNHPGFEPDLKPDFHDLGPMDKGFVGLDMSGVGGPKREPFKPLGASLLVLVLAFVAIPYWTKYDDYEVDYVGGMPVWAIIVYLLSAIGSCITLGQCVFYYDDWMDDSYATKTVTVQTGVGEDQDYEL